MQYFHKLVLANFIYLGSLYCMDNTKSVQDPKDNQEQKYDNIQNVASNSRFKSNGDIDIEIINAALILAVRHGKVSEALNYLQCGADPSVETTKTKMSAISIAAQMGNDAMLKALISFKKYKDMTSEEKVLYNNAIITAINCVFFKMVENTKKITKLANTLKILLKSGADLNYVLEQLAQYYITQIV